MPLFRTGIEHPSLECLFVGLARLPGQVDRFGLGGGFGQSGGFGLVDGFGQSGGFGLGNGLGG
jgi:hypothetical protein